MISGSIGIQREVLCEQPTPEPTPMTVDELLLKLDAEYDKITGELPELHRALGFKFFCNYERPQAWSVVEDHSVIVRKMDRQQEILNLKDTIRKESAIA